MKFKFVSIGNLQDVAKDSTIGKCTLRHSLCRGVTAFQRRRDRGCEGSRGAFVYYLEGDKQSGS